jgi:predicted carbohydrate-binding protein with CBM5 and CBM33 domain
MKDPTGTLSNGVYGQFTVPQNYVGTAAVIPVWTTTATSGTATFRVTYRTVGGDDTTSLDQSSNEEQVTLNDIAPTAAHRRMTPSASLTSANLAAGETVEFFFERYYTPDSIAADLLLFDVIFQYADA